MKNILLTVCIALASIAMYAEGLEGVKIYVNPGHGSWGPNDRPMATIPYPALASTGMPDTIGFFESNTNLWKCLELGKKLEEAGAIVTYSRTQNGPWPYEKVNGEYVGYTFKKDANSYDSLPDYTKYNRNLSEISEEVELGGYDYFISVHSNAHTDGTTTNYPIILYRGNDDGTHMAGDSKTRAQVLWPYLFEAMDAGLDPYTSYGKNSPNVRGDINFMGSSSTSTRGNGKSYTGYYGVLKHGVPGFLSEGYFHTYQPARHRALNPDYCRQEGVRYYRGIAAYYNHPAETKGYIMGTVKDLHEKMNNKLFTYNPKTNDQWVPCDSAVVTLYKGETEIAKYTVDTCRNGIFVFENLEPGNDYWLDATCKGYKPLFEEYKTPITVKANETTYPMIFLESETYEPPKIVYVDYPNPAQPAHAVLPSTFNMVQKADSTYTIEGTIKRTIGVGDSTIVLSHTADSIAHLYLIDHLTGVIKPITTNGIRALDKENAGERLALSDIAYTCDGKLIGINSVVCQYDAEQVDDGYKRGVVYLYKWDTLEADSVATWFTIENKTQLSGNFYRAVAGHSLTVGGPSNDCTITFTAVNTSSSAGMRFPYVVIADNTIASLGYNKPVATADCSPLTQGNNYLLQVSPRDPKVNFILDGELSGAAEIASTGTTHTRVGDMDKALLGAFPSETNFVKYAGRSVLVSPYANEEGQVAGVRLYDITDGLDKAVLVKTTNTDLATPVAAKFAAATAKVEGLDVTIYLVVDGIVTTFTTKGETQPIVKGIYAYGLNVTAGERNYTFSFNANDAAVNGDLVFYNDSVEVGRLPLENVVKGKNELTLLAAELPGEPEQQLMWGVELKGENIANWDVLYKETRYSTGRSFNAVDNSPESDYFGRIYVTERFGTSAAQRGNIYVYNQDWTALNETPYTGGFTWGNPSRLAVGEDGTVWFADWADNLSGIYLMDPAHPEGNYTQFFQGSRDGNGVWTNNGASVGSSTPGVALYGTGADTKLIVYNEDPSGTLPTNGVAIYNIGQEDGSVLKTWDKAPSATHAITGQANSEGGLWGTSHGYFVTQNRGKGNNNTGATALKFYDYEGNQQFSSATDGYQDIFDGNNGSSVAVSHDESMLIANNGSPEFLVFDIVWEGNKPVLTLRYKYEHGLDLSDIRAMNFDYAGNLVVTGTGGMRILSVPTQENNTFTPAKKVLKVTKLAPIAATEISLPEEVVVWMGTTEEATLTINPENAELLEILWTSLGDTIATVEDGIITAVAVGETKIAVSVKNEAMEEALTDTCTVIVKEAIAITSVVLSAEKDTLNVGETLTLEATFAPENATEPTITWTSSDEAVATVEEGVVTAVAEGKAIITVSIINDAMTEAVTATCEVVVQMVDGLLTIETSGIYYSVGTIYNPQGLNLQVFNANGQLVAVGNQNIDMYNAPQGMYIVRCEVGTLKFVK